MREARLKNKSLPLIPVKKVFGQKSKGQRILACGPRWARGDCYIVERMVGSQILIHSMINYPSIAHDDLLDSMAQLEMMEGRGRGPQTQSASPGTFDYIRALSRQKPEKTIGNWWTNDTKRKNILAVRKSYGS